VSPMATSTPPTAAAHPGRTFWPGAGASVPTQASGPMPGGGRQAPAGAPSLRSLGVDTTTLAARRPTTRRPHTVVLRCSAAALGAAAHLLQTARPPADALAQVVESDPMLMLRVLHLANQNVSRGYAVDTVPEAIEVLGRSTLRALVDELLLDAGPEPVDGLAQALARGLTCEVLTGERVAFTGGVLSGLAERLGVPVDFVLEVSGVSRSVVDAVRSGSGTWGRALRAVIAHEHHDSAALTRSGLPPIDVYDASQHAAAEARATARAIGSR
jgi:c-di-GMP-related signal transduction protein